MLQLGSNEEGIRDSNESKYHCRVQDFHTMGNKRYERCNSKYDHPSFPFSGDSMAQS